MKKLIVSNFCKLDTLLLAVCILTFGTLIAEAEWSQPSEGPTEGNTPAPIHEASESQVKNSNLIVNSLAVYGNLDLGSYMIIGDTNETCSASLEGALRYHKVGGSCLQLCGPSGWEDLLCGF